MKCPAYSGPYSDCVNQSVCEPFGTCVEQEQDRLMDTKTVVPPR